MSFITFVSGRYLRTRRKRAFISLITLLSIAGVSVGVMALIVVIAVMAGFETDLRQRIMGIRPHLVITKSDAAFSDHVAVLKQIAPIPGIESASAFITTHVILRTPTRASGALLKGVDATSGKHWISGTDTGRLATGLIGDAASQADPRRPGIILGRELAANLDVRPGDTLHMISPRGMLSPAGHMPAMVRFAVVDLLESGMHEFDGTLALIDLVEAQKLLRMADAIGGIEIRLNHIDQANAVSTVIERVIGDAYTIENWKQMNRNLFSALRLEKTVMFIILALIVMVAAFNIAGSLVMMVMEKRKDIAILKTMGATARSIGRIFVIKGLMIGLVGTALGTSAGLLLCALLERYAFIRLPSDVYYIDTLPVNLKAEDVLVIALSALVICFAATLYPARQAAGIDPVEAIRHG